MSSWLPWVRRHRARVRSTPLPAAWAAQVDRALAHHRLSAEDRALLDGLIQLFLDDKAFEGCGGLQVTDTMRVTIAAHACLLLLGLDVDVPYPGLDVIRVYPHTYRGEGHRVLGNLHVPSESQRLGESGQGYIVLSWDAVRSGVKRADGHNVVLHEFAHQLDTQDGVADGAPVLPASLYGPWARVLGEAFSELERDLANRRQTLLDSYASTNPAEFFAVATETFFEQPSALKREEPELYALFVRYYQQDPAQRA